MFENARTWEMQVSPPVPPSAASLDALDASAGRVRRERAIIEQINQCERPAQAMAKPGQRYKGARKF